MKPYIKYWRQSLAHQGGKPTPKSARTRDGKKAVRREGKKESLNIRG